MDPERIPNGSRTDSERTLCRNLASESSPKLDYEGEYVEQMIEEDKDKKMKLSNKAVE